MVRRDAAEGREGPGDAGFTGEAAEAGAQAEEEAAKAEDDPKEEAKEAPAKGGRKRSPASKKATKEEEATAALMKEVMMLAERREMGKAAKLLWKELEKRPKDDQLYHNLGCVLTEECNWPEAEEAFTKAFDLQREAGKLNFATMYGLGTVLTEQGGTFKLLQGEALFRDCLQRAIEQEDGVQETYRSYCSLTENLQLQKRWSEAAEAWKPTIDLTASMFGETHERTLAHRSALARAERLAKYQRGMRIVLWSITIAMPMLLVWGLRRSGVSMPWDMFFSNSTEPEADGAAAATDGAAAVA